VPIGEVGEVVLNVSKGRLYERVVRLRRELLWQTVTVAVLTLATLVVAFVIVWFLIQRTRRLERKHREAEELAALGGLAANLAHEIRNPLNSINLNLELLEEDLEDGGAEAVASLAGTRQEVARLARLVSDFLTYARPTEPILEEVATAKVLREVHEFLGAEARASGVHLRLGRDPFEGTVLSDPGQLRQVLLNLVLNAIQAVVGLQADRRLVELVTAVDGNEVKLIVRDRGDGIPDAELPRVRRAFYTRRRGGTGLGLAIAERYVEAHSGRIELENLAGGGFEARVVLPIHRGDGKMSAASAH
jgi:signal transduction histidine kinase